MHHDSLAKWRLSWIHKPQDYTIPYCKFRVDPHIYVGVRLIIAGMAVINQTKK